VPHGHECIGNGDSYLASQMIVATSGKTECIVVCGPRLTGGRFLSAFGVDLTARTRRIFCQPCLDWSERRYHLKGLVGARILDRLLELGWLKCVSDSRALQLTSSGRAGLSEIFQIEINNEGVPIGRLCDPRANR
jgi:hypothetical protein